MSDLLVCTVTCRQFPNLTFAPRKTCHRGSNLTLHSYHATALDSIHDDFGKRKHFFQKNLLFFNVFPIIYKEHTHQLSCPGKFCLTDRQKERDGQKTMWTAENWKDYEVIDTSSGEKLERWGDYLLVRPDPQVIWNTPKEHSGWRKMNGHYHRSAKGGGEWEFFQLPDEWSIQYGELTFHLKPFSFKHTGLFPEQAANWDWFSSIIRKAVKDTGRPVKVLNLFAYTGGATIAAAKAGASVTHVDASKGMVTWAKENAVSSGLGNAPIRWLVDDCVKFVEREIRRGNTYDAIIMDPPSYGRGPKGEIWKIEENIFPFLELTAKILSKDALFFLINSYTTGLQPAVLSYMLHTVIVPQFGGTVRADEIGLPVSSNGLILPCGASGRWWK